MRSVRARCPEMNRVARMPSGRRIGTMTTTFKPEDYRDKITVSGGDFLSELLARAQPPSPLWERLNVKRPDIVRVVADAFVGAGAVVLATNTDRANAVSLSEAVGAGDVSSAEITSINREGAAIYRAALDGVPGRSGGVFGAIGPVEPLLMLDEIKEQVLHDAYRAQAEALAEGGVDAILCRSFTELESLLIAVKAAIQAAGLPVVASMTFDAGPDYTETSLGVTVPQACTALVDAGVAMVGCDHGMFPDATDAIVSLLRESCDLPVWVEVNAGQAELQEEHVVHPEPPEPFAERLAAIVGAGASFMGGGRGTSAGHIAALVRARETYQRRAKRQT